MYSRTRDWIESQLARMQIGVRNVVSTSRKIEMPSTPRW